MDDVMKQEFLQQMAAVGGQASMWEVGQTMGLDRPSTEALAMELMSEGALEMVNLSGGVSLTEAGRAGLGGDDGGGDDLESWLAAAQAAQAAGDLGLDGAAGADLAADLAALTAQAGRSQPLAAVRRGLVEAVVAACEKAGSPAALGLARRGRGLLA